MQHRTNAKALTGLNGLSLSEGNMNEIGDDHVQTAADTPIRPDAFTLTNGEKIEKIEGLFKQIMETLGLVVIDAKHMCVASRGIRDTHSATVTSFYGGQFVNSALKKEFLRYAGMTTVY